MRAGSRQTESRQSPRKIDIDVVVHEGAQEFRSEDYTPLARQAARAALISTGAPCEAEISVVLTDDLEIRELNRLYRGIDKPTNVLSWATKDLYRQGSPPAKWRRSRFDPPGLPFLGDIFISMERTVVEASYGGWTETDAKELLHHPPALSTEAHFMHLVIHATLHLIGYNHEFPEDAELMEKRERMSMRLLGLHDPYLFHDIENP